MAAVFRPSIIKHLMRLGSRPAAAYSEIDFIDADPDNIVFWIAADPAIAAPSTTDHVKVGTATFTATAVGGVAALHTTSGFFYTYTTGTTATNLGGWFINSGGIPAILQTQDQPIMRSKVRTGTSIADQRIWVGMTSAATAANLANDNQGTAGFHAALFRYSTSAGDANWQAITANGAAQTVTDTGIAVATSTRYRFRIDVFDNTSIKFYINDVLVATHTATLPTTTTAMSLVTAVQITTTTARTLSVAKVHVRHQQP